VAGRAGAVRCAALRIARARSALAVPGQARAVRRGAVRTRRVALRQAATSTAHALRALLVRDAGDAVSDPDLEPAVRGRARALLIGGALHTGAKQRSERCAGRAAQRGDRGTIAVDRAFGALALVADRRLLDTGLGCWTVGARAAAHPGAFRCRRLRRAAALSTPTGRPAGAARRGLVRRQALRPENRRPRQRRTIGDAAATTDRERARVRGRAGGAARVGPRGPAGGRSGMTDGRSPVGSFAAGAGLTPTAACRTRAAALAENRVVAGGGATTPSQGQPAHEQSPQSVMHEGHRARRSKPRALVKAGISPILRGSLEDAWHTLAQQAPEPSPETAENCEE